MPKILGVILFIIIILWSSYMHHVLCWSQTMLNVIGVNTNGIAVAKNSGDDSSKLK